MAGTQVKQGKAFEYICMESIRDHAASKGISVTIDESGGFGACKACADGMQTSAKALYRQGADAAVDFIFDCEPYLYDNLMASHLHIAMQSDSAGQAGDVRDLLCLRWIIPGVRKWEIGVSCKHNHVAIKHPRINVLASTDFLHNWTGGNYSLSPSFKNAMGGFIPAVNQKIGEDWDAVLGSDGTFRDRLLETATAAVADELRRHQGDPLFAEILFRFLLGTKDFYKVMIFDKERLSRVSIFNFYGTLNQKTKNAKPARVLRKLTLPQSIISISNKKQYLWIVFDKGWSVRLRLHNASGKVEPSMKFDAQLEGMPMELMNLAFPW